MKKALGFNLSPSFDINLIEGKNRLLIIEVFRLVFLYIVLLVFLGFQIKDNLFTSLDLVIPIYAMLGTAFLINTIYLFSFDQKVAPRFAGFMTAFLFLFDSVFISSLVLTTGTAESIFLFLYLVNIILCGLVFRRRGAFVLALFTSISFSGLMILDPNDPGTQTYFTVGVNNLAFFGVAYLSGYLSEQIGFMGEQIAAQKKDIKVLQDLNKLIVESMPSGLLTFDTEGSIAHCNIAAQKILRHELTGEPIDSFIPSIWERMQTRGYKRYEKERWEEYVILGGEKLLLGMTVSPLISQEGESFGFILLFQDLTQIKSLEEAARRNEKMAAIGQLAAGIAHEIRNPLASISGSIQLLKSSDSGNEENTKLFGIVLKEIDRLNVLITDFLGFARPDGRPNDPVNVNKVLKEVLDMVKVNDKLPQNVLQTVNLKASSEILGQADKLKQVFLNLIINAYQALEDTKLAEIGVSTYEQNGSVFVKIKDNGPGLNPDVKNRIFEPFLTTKPSGTGLGLATAHKILENHGAIIHVESEPGDGVEFTIEFQELFETKDTNVIDMQHRRSQG